MYESQVRLENVSRKLAERQSPKQQYPILDCYRRAIDYAARVLKFNFAMLPHRTSTALTLAIASVSVLVAGCGGVNYDNATGAQGNSVALNQISCGTQSLSGAQSKACTVSLSASALSSTTVNLSSNSASLKVPAQVTIAVGQTSVSFNAVSSAVTKAVTATITGSLRGVSKTFALTVYPLGSALSGLSCASQSLLGPTSTTCTLTLNSAAASATAVTLNTSSTAIQIPAAVTVNSGVNTAQFSVTALAVSSTQNVTLTASSGGVSQTYVLQVVGSGTQSSQHKVQLSWNPPSGSSVAIAGYRVYRAIANTSSFALLNASIDTQTSFTDSGVASGTTYDYLVTSVDVSGTESSPSNSTEVTIP